MKQFDITYYYGPSSEYVIEHEECVADIAAAGITLCQLRGKTTEANRKAIPVFKKYGLRVSIYEEDRITQLIRSSDFEQIDEVIQEVVADYAEFDNIDSWDIFDEPSTDKFPILAAVSDALHKYDPEREVVINLFPNYATPEQLKDTDYVSHLNHFVETVRPDFLSYDHYHFMGRVRADKNTDANGAENERDRLIRLGAEGKEDRDVFFENLEDVRRVGLENNLEQMLIVLLTEHGDYRNLTRAELLWEVNMCLVYGMHRISYFTYWLPYLNNDFWQRDNSMCDREGNKFEHYYDVQVINERIRPIGERIFATKSTAVFHIGKPEKGTKTFEGYGAVRTVAGESAVIGFFDNGDVYLVNRDFRNENTLTIDADKALSVYKDGVFSPVGDTYTVTLEAGEGVLLRI